MKQYDSYKDSGVEWIGMIPSHWEIMKIKNVASFNDEVLPDNFDKNECIEYVEISDVNNTEGIKNTTFYKFKDAPSRARRKTVVGDIIISTVRTYLKAIAKVDRPNLIVSTGFVVIRPKIDTGFMAYTANSEPFIADIVSQSVGVSYPAISSIQVVNNKISVPPIAEQRAIVNYLDVKTAKIDSIVASREKKIKLLEELRASIISEAVTKGIHKNVEMKDSGIEWIGRIPKHWEVVAMKRIMRIIRGGSPRPIDQYFSETGYNWIKIGDTIKGDKYIRSTVQRIKPEGLKSTRLVKRGDLILSNSMTFGEPYILDIKEGCIHDGWLALSGFKGVDKEFLYYMLLSDLCQVQFESSVDGGVVKNLNIDKAGLVQIFVPPMEEQIEIVNFIDSKINTLNTHIYKTNTEISLLKEYRNSLITEVVTGKRKVVV